MNDLNTQQIVLLCLLVSFVSSVATGITTVSLLDQAPEPVAQTINRVVERTIERVVDPVVSTVTNTSSKPERVVETVVVNQEDLTVEAVEKNSKSLVRIYGSSRNNEKFFVGLGVVISSDGKVLTSSTIIGSAENFYAEYVDGSYELNLVKEANQGSVILEPKEVEEGKTFTSAKFGNSQNLKLAQTVISLGGQDRNLVSTGIISTLETNEASEIILVSTSISESSIIRGSVLISLNGEIIGVRVAGSSANSFIPSNIIKSSMEI
jgi:S1-C subfamily serine protease